MTTDSVSSSIRPADADAGSSRNLPIYSAHQRLEATALAGYAAFLIYLSLVPFDLSFSPPTARDTRWIFGLRVAPISMPDIVANVAFYLPLGAVWFHLHRQGGRSRAAAALWAAMGCAALSLAIEQAQRWFPSRVSSWVDVSSNLAGAMVGIGISWFGENALRRAAGRARELAARRWWLAVGRGFIVFVLAVQLRPFDPVVDPHHTASAALRRADPRPWSRWRELETTAMARHQWDHDSAAADLARSQWEYGLDRAVDVAMYAAVAALLVVGRWRKGSHAFRLYLWAGCVSVGLAVLVTGVRIFLISHGLDTAQVICGAVGWPIGCFVAWMWATRAMPSGREATLAWIGPPPLAWQRGLALAGMAMVVLYEMAPFKFQAQRPADLQWLTTVCWIPFAAHTICPVHQAVYDLSGDWLRYAVFGACFSTLLRWRNRRQDLTACVLVAMLTCTVLETLHLWMPSRFSDVTTIVMAVAGSFAGVASLQWARRLHAGLTSLVAADPLTSQLIEGATYQPLPTPPVRPRAGTSPKDPAQSAPRR